MPPGTAQEKPAGSGPEIAERSPLLDAVRKVLLASVGAVALAQGELEDFVNGLVERGEIAEQDGRKLVHELIERRNKTAAKAEAGLEGRVEELLNRMNVPTKADLDRLSAKIAALVERVDELKRT